MWRWFCYDDGEVYNLWARWYSEADDVVRGKHDAIFDLLELRCRWGEPHTKVINDGIIEIRVRAKVQHRLLGFFGPGERGEFTFVLTCTHKQNVYSPPKAKKTAAKRKKAILGGTAHVLECTRPETPGKSQPEQAVPRRLS